MALYYSTQLARPLTTERVRSTFGFNPDTYDIDILNDQYGLFPVNTVAAPAYDTNLYSGYTAVYSPNVDGNTYDQSFAFTERPLADAQANAIAKLKDDAEYDSIIALGGTPVSQKGYNSQSEFDPNGPYHQIGGESATIFCAQSYLAAASRLEPYKSIATSINAIATVLDATIADVNAATDIDGVKLAYRPVSGDIDIERAGNNIVSGVFNTLTGATFAEMSLLILDSGYVCYYDENNGGFTALGGELGAGASDVELYAGATLVGTFTVPSGNGTTNFTF